MKKSQSTRLILCTACLLLHSVHATRMTKERKECMGTNAEMSYPMDLLQHYSGLVKRYTNCTYVNGNLEITGIPENMDMSFVKDIEIVTGYVIIAMNKVDYVPLENLMVIRGQELYHDKDALYVSVNINRDLPFVGLKAVGLKSLTEIQRGNIHFTENHLLCYVDTINWLDIINPTAREKNGWSVYINNTRDPAITCEPCHKSCNGSCWGPGEDDCQKLTSTICHQRCGNSRCRGPGPDECCHRECAVGCTGPTDADCIVCQHINNSGICQLTCPQKHIFDPQTQRFVENPDVKYHLNGDCVDHCPEHMLVEDNGCVKHCRKGNHNNGEGECVPCAEDACNKECYGIGNPDAPDALADTVDANNTKYFEGCNIVRGNIIIQAYVFEGDEQNYIPAMTAEQVMKSFSSIKVINGYLNILGWHKNLSDFSAFGNLTTIRGNQLFRGVAAIVIQDTTAGSPYHLDSITSLGFRSLKRVEHGNVYIGYMRNLCYVDSVNWTQVLKNPRMSNRFRNGVMLRNNKRCYDEYPCHPACDDNGCWGPKDNECVTCSNIVFGDRCVLDCDKELGVYNSGKECVPCDSECEYTCDGAGPMNCTRCKNFNNGGVCVPDCPNDMYGDEDTKTCLPCNETCLHQRNNSNSPMCSGPASKLGSGGCTFCHTVMADRHLRRQQCLPITSRNCPPAHYGYDNAGMSDTKLICVPCIHGCRNCTGSTEKDCVHSLPQGESAIVMSIVILVVFIVLVAVVMLLIRHRRKKSEKERQKSLRALGLAEGTIPEPMTPSGVAPNQAQLRIVKETELRIGKILGTGAFGTVHNGYWIPDLAPGEKVKVPVAIKVLRDESSKVQNNEILDEAFVMASCEHPNLVRLLGISLSQKTMLITQLMPLGNLLEYVRDNKDNIGSQTLLNWCLQIAKGMCYLAEEKHLVHRDLAARNVLVKSPNHVRITDFGLAKLLDVNEDVYRAEGGKMPVKWLALESIRHRIFTQKSDVWGFGVTIWELMTFGKKPYENVPARDVYTLLERGERLLQPTTCTIDVYMLMIKCWTVDPDSRPTFRELIEDFSKMARDPQRYLVIDNDGSLPALPSPTNSEFFRSLKHDELDDFPLQDAEDYLPPAASNIPARVGANGNPFTLQPAPTRSQRRRHQVQPKPNGSRFTASSSTTDSRLDSTFTVMTSLPSESSAYPNGCSTPHATDLSGSNASRDSTREGVPAFTRFNSHSGRSRDRAYNGNTDHHSQPTTGPRIHSDSSDVFIASPGINLKDTWDASSRQPLVPEHPTRAREDSATMRYSAEPGMTRQESKPNESSSSGPDGIPEDKDGYLDPTKHVAQNPDYLDPLFSTEFSGDVRYVARSTSFGMENPEYEPTFISHAPACLFDRQISTQDDDGYEIPISPDAMPRHDVAEYENTQPGLSKKPGYLEEDANGYLMVNNPNSTERRHSTSGESTSSGHRDSGVPSDGDEGLPLNPKNAGNADGARASASDASPSAGSVDRNNSVNNPNYELLENMTDGGFAPMSEFVPKDTPSPFHGDYNNSARSKGQRRNPLQLTIDCSSCEDPDDNIFITPESQRRATANAKNSTENGISDPYDSPEHNKRCGPAERLGPDFDELTGHSVPRTYSEPDSGVGIECGIDNVLYHRLGSFGCEAGE